MGRKKRKTADTPESEVVPPPLMDLPIPPAIPRKQPIPQAPAIIKDEPVKEEEIEEPKKEGAASSYSMKAHGAEIIDEDIYVSDGSEDEEEQEIEMLLVGSRLGVMRKGIHHQMLVQPNRQWTRKTEQTESEEKDDEEAEQKRLKEQEEELANLDPAQRAARLLVEKQRKLEEAKETARRLESEENAGRDPCLFSKRTAFDIRFDQIDDKPWTRGDPTDYFNYGLLEEDWLEYAQQQLMIRQELTDASRQRRAADPTLVPVTPRMPSKQQPKVAVAPTGTNKLEDDEDGEGDDSDAVVGPVLVVKQELEPKEESTGPTKPPPEVKDIPVGVGGAWGAGAAPGSVLAKLIEEQEKKLAEAGDDNESYMDTSQDGSNSMMSPHKSSRYSSHNNNDSWQEPPTSHSMPPPPPPQSENRWQQQHPTDNSDNNSYYGNNSVNSGNDWSNSGRGGGYQQQQSHYQQQQPPPPPQQQQQRFDPRAGRGYMGRGGDRGGRSYMGGRGGRGGGRGHYNDSGGGGRGRGGGAGHYGGGGGDDGGYHRKRPRDSYDDHGGSRGGGGGWRR